MSEILKELFKYLKFNKSFENQYLKKKNKKNKKHKKRRGIPLLYKPKDLVKIKDFVWICPPEFSPSFSYSNQTGTSSFDQTIWIFDSSNELGYLNGKYYVLIGENYSYGYVNGTVSLIDGKVSLTFNNITYANSNNGIGQYVIPKKKCEKPYFSMETLQVATIITEPTLTFNNFSHVAAAIPILPGDLYYNKLPFSTPDPSIQISVPEFINRCVNT